MTSDEVARIPTLAPHFGAAANGPFDKETQMVPIIGLDNSETSDEAKSSTTDVFAGKDTFVATQPERLVKAIAKELGINDCKWLWRMFPPHLPYVFMSA